jgi:hypothetical protein
LVHTVVVGAGAGGRAVPGGPGREPSTAVGQQGPVLGLGGIARLLLLLGASAIGGEHREERGERHGLEGEPSSGHALHQLLVPLAV